MKVLHIFNEINFSGAEVMYANAAPLFQQQGIEMIAFNTGKGIGNYVEHFEKADIKVVFKPIVSPTYNPLKLFSYFSDVRKFILDNDIDIIHIHRSQFYWFFALCGFLTGRKAIRTVHNVFHNRKITWMKAYLERMTSRRMLGLTFQTIGESVHDNELRYYKNASVRVNNWFDNIRFFPPVNVDEQMALRKQLGIDEERFVIISAGSCSITKNHSAIIEAVAIVKKQYPNIMYLHLGHGAQETQEKRLALEKGIEDNIIFLGNKFNVRDYLIASDVFVMTSKFEGLSIAAIEAMGCKLPVILYDSPGLRDLIKENDNGFLIKHDPVILSEKIIQFYNNRDLIKEKGTNALNFATSNFSMPKCVDQIIELYKSAS